MFIPSSTRGISLVQVLTGQMHTPSELDTPNPAWVHSSVGQGTWWADPSPENSLGSSEMKGRRSATPTPCSKEAGPGAKTPSEATTATWLSSLALLESPALVCWAVTYQEQLLGDPQGLLPSSARTPPS